MAKINRLVLNFPGFETTTAVHQIGRLSAGGEKTAGLWGFSLNTAEVEEVNSYKTVTDFASTGKNWNTETRYVQFSWADIISKYENVPYPRSLVRHLPGYLSFFFDGSVFKYAAASGRYCGFTVYPLLLMILFSGLSGLLMGLMSGIFGLHWIIALSGAVLLFLLLCKFPGDRFYVNLSVNDWAFARDMCNGKNPEITARFEEFSRQILDEIHHSKPDEILIVGHSFGSVWACAALAKALELDEELLASRRVTFLALGSSLLKIGLVKNAEFLRASVQQIVGLNNLVWHEIQTKTDFISFYKSEPFEPMGIVKTACETIVHRVNFKHALSKSRHKKMMKSMYLAHRQYILYCDRRVHHDFQLRVFGPFFADELARDTNLAINSPLIGEGESTP